MTIPLSSVLFSAATMIIGTSSSVATISFKFESAVETRAGLMMSSPDRIASPMVMASLLFRSAFDIAERKNRVTPTSETTCHLGLLSAGHRMGDMKKNWVRLL